MLVDVPTPVTFDTEFSDDGVASPTPISLGLAILDPITLEVQSTFYREFTFNNASVFGTERHRNTNQKWLKANVAPHLHGQATATGEIAKQVADFVGEGPVSFHAKCGMTDWFLLTRLFGTLEDKPRNWPWYFHELMQTWEARGFNKKMKPVDRVTRHHALEDALWDAEFLRNMHLGARG